ncbi:hypothetical protein SGPA1_20410 [Streptomyces misionensis JCM 4497]
MHGGAADRCVRRRHLGARLGRGRAPRRPGLGRRRPPDLRADAAAGRGHRGGPAQPDRDRPRLRVLRQGHRRLRLHRFLGAGHLDGARHAQRRGAGPLRLARCRRRDGRAPLRRRGPPDRAGPGGAVHHRQGRPAAPHPGGRGDRRRSAQGGGDRRGAALRAGHQPGHGHLGRGLPDDRGTDAEGRAQPAGPRRAVKRR